MNWSLPRIEVQSRSSWARSVLDEGADDVCYKPFDVPRLLEMLRRLSGADRQ